MHFTTVFRYLSHDLLQLDIEAETEFRGSTTATALHEKETD